MMELLLDSGKNTLNLLENLLQWSGNKGNGLNPDMEPTNITLLVKEAIKMTDAQASFKKVEVQFEVHKPIYVKVDRNMILSVIRNLVSNAIKFSGAHSVVDVSLAERSDDILVSVKDSGVGMTEEECNALFSGNSLHKKLGTQGEKGVGMGLKICKDFVDVHDGSIWVNSRPGEGSTFYFTLKKVAVENL